MPLPIYRGYILPNGSIIDASGGIGHTRAAMRYINAHPTLLAEFKKSKEDNDEDFLMKVCGAVKICAYGGQQYIYVPYMHGPYVSSIKGLYEMYGFKVIYFSSYFCENLSEESIKLCSLQIKEYTPQIVWRKDPQGRTVYFYNPNRIGD